MQKQKSPNSVQGISVIGSKAGNPLNSTVYCAREDATYLPRCRVKKALECPQSHRLIILQLQTRAQVDNDTNLWYY